MFKFGCVWEGAFASISLSLMYTFPILNEMRSSSPVLCCSRKKMNNCKVIFNIKSLQILSAKQAFFAASQVQNSEK